MTDFHYPTYRRRVILYRHAKRLKCPACGANMKRGRGKGTQPDPHLLERERDHA